MRVVPTRIFVCDDCGYNRLEIHSSEDVPDNCPECERVDEAMFYFLLQHGGKK
jgi:hypothetical protein